MTRMVHRTDSLPELRRAMRVALDEAGPTPCKDRPAVYSDMRHDVDSAAALCHDEAGVECPLLILCRRFAKTEGIYAEGVYGGVYFKKGKPVSGNGSIYT